MAFCSWLGEEKLVRYESNNHWNHVFFKLAINFLFTTYECCYCWNGIKSKRTRKKCYIWVMHSCKMMSNIDWFISFYIYSISFRLASSVFSILLLMTTQLWLIPPVSLRRQRFFYINILQYVYVRVIVFAFVLPYICHCRSVLLFTFIQLLY
jgi:hypothetical protein